MPKSGDFVLEIMPPYDVDWIRAYLAGLAVGQPLLLSKQRALHGEGWRWTAWPKESDCQAAAVIMQTSGSTGGGDFVPLTANNLVANGTGIIETLGISQTDRVLLSLPLSYSFGLSLLNTGLAAGGMVCVCDSPAGLRAISEAIKRHECSIVGFVPSTALRATKSRYFTDLSSLRMVQVAGGSLSPADTRQLIRATPRSCQLYIMYGLTEATARVSAFDVKARVDKLGSVGKAIRSVGIRVEDSAGRQVPRGTEGRIVVVGDGVSAKFARSDGSLLTPDFGYIDDQSFVWITGRDGSFAKVGGVRVPLAPFEAAALSVEGVTECVALVINDEVLGERICLVVEIEDEKCVKRADILRATPQPSAIESIRVVRMMPRVESGKPARAKIAADLFGLQELHG